MNAGVSPCLMFFDLAASVSFSGCSASTFSSARPNRTSGPQVTARVDHQLNSANNLAVRSTISRISQLSGTQAAYQLTDTFAQETTNGVASAANK